MSDGAELYLQRAENELVAAQMLFDVSSNPILQKSSLSWKKNSRFTAPLLVIRIIRSFILQKLF